MRQMSSTVELTPPVSRRDHQQGPATAPVTLVEYGDYECPYCGMAYPIVKEVQRRMRDQMRFVFRHFPLVQVHPHAVSAAEAAEAAGAQGKFWEMHDTLYEHQRALEGSHLVFYAVSLGLDRERFIRDLTSHAYLEHIREDILSGVDSGVEGTPFFFINGARYRASYDLESLLAAVELATVS